MRYNRLFIFRLSIRAVRSDRTVVQMIVVWHRSPSSASFAQTMCVGVVYIGYSYDLHARSTATHSSALRIVIIRTTAQVLYS